MPAIAFGLLGLIVIGLVTSLALGGGGDPLRAAAATEVAGALRSQALLIRQRLGDCRLRQLESADPWPPVPADGLVRSLACAGSALWAGQDARFLPRPHRAFGEWVYQRSGTGIAITTTATGGDAADAGFRQAVQGAAGRFAPGEAVVDLTQANRIVFTVWIKVP